jgi:hypothetical protein
MKDVTGGRLPAEIWRNFVVEATGAVPDPKSSDDVPVADDPAATDEGVQLAAEEGASGTEFAEAAAPEPVPEAPAEAVPSPVPVPTRAAGETAPPRGRPEPVARAAEPQLPEAPVAKSAPAVAERPAVRQAPAASKSPAAAPAPKQAAKPKAVAKRDSKPARKTAEAKPKQKAEPKVQQARRVPVNRLAPVIEPGRLNTMSGRLAQNRVVAEEYAAQRRAAAEGRVRVAPFQEEPGGPIILRRARGLP